MTLLIQLFDQPEKALQVVKRLGDAGLRSEQIGFLSKEGVHGEFRLPAEANPDDMSAREGTLLGTFAGVVAGVLLVSPIGPIVAAGPLFAAVFGALAGGATGGIVAGLIDAGVDESTANRIAFALENDEVLLSVEAEKGQLAEVERILNESPGGELLYRS